MAFSPTRGWAVGLTVAAFAAGGMIVSTLGALFGAPADVPQFFGMVGGLFFLNALALGFLLRGSELRTDKRQRPSGAAGPRAPTAFLRLAVGYFALCYIGLMVVSYGVAILQESRVSAAAAALVPFVLNAGYIAGAVLGGFVAAGARGRWAPLAFLGAATLAALALAVALPPAAAVTAVFVIGMGFGSTVSVFVMVLTETYGRERAGVLFGRLNIGYGMAGVMAPSITGWLYGLSDGYAAALGFGGLVGILGLFAMAGTLSLSAKTQR